MEDTLTEWVNKLPEIHQARKQLQSLEKLFLAINPWMADIATPNGYYCLYCRVHKRVTRPLRQDELIGWHKNDCVFLNALSTAKINGWL